MTKWRFFLVFYILILVTVIPELRAEDTAMSDIPDQNVEIQSGIKICPMTRDEKRVFRRQLMTEFIERYTENQTFDKINQYMASKYQEMNKAKPPASSNELLEETFDKANNLFVQTKKYYGNSFTHVYDPEMVEKKVRKYLWLKGIFFFILGIEEEHRVAMSYFYLPGNETIKQDFMERVVRFSFPEVPDVPENTVWRKQMDGVMDRLGYDVFNIKKFKIAPPCPEPTP